MSEQNSNKAILDVVESAKEKAKKAMKSFDAQCGVIQRKASRNIDLFGGSAVSSVADIAEKSREACDELYVSLQALVPFVDVACKDALDKDTTAETIKAVVDCIAYLNSESKIKNNFTASFNSASLGDVARVSYFPSLANQTIEKYWENLYESIPEVAEANKKKEQEKLDAETEKKIRLEKIKLEYRKANEKWRKEIEEINRIRNQEISDSVEEFKNRTLSQYKSEYEEKEKTYLEQLKTAQKLLDDETALYNSLGSLALLKKSKSKKQIEEMTTCINTLKEKIKFNQESYQAKVKNISIFVENQKEKVEKAVYTKYPLPKEPQKPAEIRFEGMTATQIALACMRDEVYEFLLKENKSRDVEYIIEHCMAVSDMTNQHVYRMLETLKNEGKVKITKGTNGNLYRAIEE